MHPLPSQNVAHIISSLDRWGAGPQQVGRKLLVSLLVTIYYCCFTAATKHHSQGSIEKKSLLGCAGSEVEAMAIMVGNMVVGKALKQYMRACIPIPKHKAERPSWQWHGTSKFTPSETPPTRPHPLVLSK